ncbi:response regulator [Geitlerinema sp. PCC 7407]|uniref:response regulator n=1 Tax=Geitlerinema sp. PCC 7407 TaxID=1173025 RepID=UPI00029FA534|nr:response regulator [Geitlerinema sp. PCC 7407]AFY64922.1 adenylate/guanylate cyclase with GAF sensor(s) [Geitlerinema sp. PCC 7407]
MKASEDSKPKILVVDDEPDNLDLLYRTFRREFKVLRAENGPAALEILEAEGDVAVIISDQRMPLMSGTEFLSLTATRYPDIIRIILTGYTDVEDLVEAINAGKVFKYVTKPWDDEELRGVVQQAVDTHNVLRARTRELCRTLRQESLLNAVTNTIRSALNYRQILQTIATTVGQMFEVSCCVLRPFRDGRLLEGGFLYRYNPAEHLSLDLDALSGSNISLPSVVAANGIAVKADGADVSMPRFEDLGQLRWTVWATDQVQVIQDVAGLEGGETPEEQQRLAAYRTSNIQSSLVVPLICRQELLAVMALHQCDRPYAWQDDEVQLITMVADQAALALAQAWAYEQMQALAKRESLVNTITSAIRSSLEPEEIFAAITEQLGQGLQVDGCALSLWTEEDEYVRCVGLHDPHTHEGQISLDREEISGESGGFGMRHLPQSSVPIAANPVLQQLIRTQQPVQIDDLSIHPEMNMLDVPLRSPARALLVVPLLHNGKIIGSISLRQTQRPRRWQPSEVELAQAVASQAAIAVQQAELYQKTRQQAEQLLELDRQKTEFFQNISHEFRTPLTLTIGPLESAVNQQTGLSAEQATIALRNSRRLLRLVNQLLDLQRLDAGRMQPTFSPCDLTEFVGQIADIFRAYCERKGIHFVTELAPCPPVYLDAEKFDKVLYNLLSNAMKFTAAGGSITVRLQPEEESCILQIQDTGIGIRADQIPHLFERFRQAEGSANRSYEGSGLGLALVKELVDSHGGQIIVSSNYGEGTTFTVVLRTGSEHLPTELIAAVPTELQADRATVEFADLEMELQSFAQTEDEVDASIPAGAIAPVPAPESIAASNGAASSQILVVDDNPDLRTYVSAILRQEGYRVRTAVNGADGFEKAKNHHPELIVTDLMMPLVSGLDMIGMIREDVSLQGTPIILLTAKADADTRIEGAERGADAYLSKPFNDRELLAEVRNLLALKANERRVAELNTYLTESVLRRFLPPSMVLKAATGDLMLDLRPEPRLVTILFSDIVGFTQLANTLRSRRVAELLNEYLAEMTQAIFDNGGTVDKFMGDAILALFGAPEELSPNEQVRRAIGAARQMHVALAKLNRRWEEQGIGHVEFRCGIHQGTAVVGMFGSEERADYTAIGPSVNIASRLQEAATPNSILVSAAVADYLEEEEIVKCSPLKLKGVDETVLTFALKPTKEETFAL